MNLVKPDVFNRRLYKLRNPPSAQADDNGDGKTDVAVYRGEIWFLQQSQTGFTGAGGGAATDKPVINVIVP